MQLTGDTGNLYTKGDVYVGNSTTNKVVTLTGTETLTNKTISGSSNTLSDIAQSSITGLTDDLALSTSWFARQSSSQINLASDPNCSDPLAWVSCGSVWSPSVITSEQHSGTSCLEMTVLAANYASADFVRSVDGKNLAANSADYQASAMKVRSGDKFYAEIWVKTDAANTGPIPQFYIQFWSTDSNIGYSSYSFTNVGGITPVAGVWTKISGSYTIPAGKDRLEVRVATGLMVSSNIGDVFFLDDMVLFNITESQDIIDTIYQGINGGSATLKSLTDMKTSVETLVTKTGTQTLTNKTLTSPKVNQLLDTNGVAALAISATASAVNYATITNAATGGNVDIAATGSDTNVYLRLKSKGTNGVVLMANNANSGVFFSASSAVNYAVFTSKATGQAPTFSVSGADTNISLNLVPKGTGTVQANGVDVVTTTDTQTLTNKTLTAPAINNATALSVGQTAALLTATPANINLGGTYGSNTVGTEGNLKLRVFDDGTYHSGIGFSPARMEYQVSPNNYHSFYVGGVERFTISSSYVRIANVDVVTISGTQTLTNKTISASNNTISNIAVSNLAASAVVTAAETIAANNNDTTIPTSAAVKSYVDSTGSGDASTNTATSVDSEVAVFSGTTGKLLKRATGSGIAKLTSGVLSTVTAPSGTIVGTTDAQTLTNKTISTSTIVGPVSMDSPGALTVVDASLVNANFAIASNMGAYPAYNAFSKYLWHDLLRFSRWTGAPTYETYASGSWGAQTLNTLIFSGKEATAYTLVDGTTASGVRWTWHSGNLAYSYLRWWVIGFAYTNPAQVNDVLVESSTDGVSWTTRHTSTTTANAVPAWFAASDHGAAYYLRLTITTANAQPIRISSIKGLSARWGDQGGGSEQEYPYEWDGSRNITIGSSGARSDGALNVGDASATTAAEGIYFGNDTNLYRSAANTLKTDDNLAIGTSTQTPTATPANINLGGTYGNNTVGTQGNLKLRLYDNGSGSNHFGLGISDSKLEYQVPNGSGHHFYVNGVERLKITNSVFQIAGADVVTTTGTQTLTNKTLTSPKADQILDTNGAVSIYLYARPSAVNYASINNGVTGGDVQYSVNGTDANINLGLRPKGTGMVWIQDSGASGIARFRNNTGITNWWDFTSEGSGTDISARAGGEANVGIDLVPKGTGTVKASGVPVVTTNGTQTLTNKTISGSSNTLSNIPQSAVTSLTTDLASITTNVELAAKSSNLIPDPNFEDNTVTRFGYGGVTPTYTSADAFQGTYSLTWTSTSSTWQGPYFSPVQSGKKRFVCNPGETFRVKLKIKPDASNNMTVGYVRIFMRFWTTATSGTYTDRAAGTYAINNTSMAAGWQDMDCFGICPTDKGALEVFVINDPNTTNGNIYYVDCVTVEQVSYGQEVVDAAVQAIAGGSTTGYSIANLKTNMQSLVTLTGTQTLTNKTLTSPTINTATLSGATSVTGNLTVDNGTSTLIDVISDDTGSSGIRLIGNSQGTGYVEVGQSTQYGGGMYYNGDGSPAFATGESADTIGFYRNNNNVRSEVFYYSYGNDNVYFNGVIYSGGVAIPTISSTDTLTNKTISGSNNTLTNIPVSAVPDAAKFVRSHGTTANEWYKVFTFTPPASDYVRLNMMLAISGFTGGGAIIQISLGNTSTGNANASVEYIAKGYTPMLNDDSFKIVSDGYGQPFELWVKTVNTNGGVCSYYEISRYGGPAYLTYDTGNTHTPTEPTGSSINVYSAGMVNNAVPVVNTTATQTLTNKTLTSPVLSTASTALTVGTGSAGTTTPSRIVFENAYATNTPGSNANQKIQLYSGYGFGVSASTLEYQTNTGAVHKFFVGGTERLTIGTSDVTIGGVSAATTTGTQTLTNKTISLASNTLTTTFAQLNSAVSDVTLIKPVSLFNNMGDVHTTRTSFDAQGAASTVDFGWRFVQGNTNGPGTNGAAQYYSALIGLGDNYAFNNYAMQIAYPRNVTNPYISIRYQEGGSFGAWQKISAGYADTSGSATTATTATNQSGGTVSATTGDFSTYIRTDEIRDLTGAQLVLNAGESAGYATGQTGEYVYVNAEGGLQVNSSPDNWGSGWAGRKTATINDASGDSTFPGTIQGTRLISTIATGTAPLTVSSTTKVTNLNADLLDDMSAASANTASTVMARDANGDTNVRYLNSSYVNMSHSATTRSSDTVFYSSTDAYIRKNNATGFKTSLALNNVDNTSDATKNSATATLTNKTISGSSNTLTNIAISSLSATGTPSASTYLRGDGTWAAAGGGDASTNTATSVDSEVVLFSGTGGKTLKRATGSGIAKLTSGVLSVVTAPSGTIVGTTDTQTLTNKTLTNPTVNNYTEGVVSIGTVTTSSTLSLTNGTVQTATLTASTACTFTMPTATAGKSFVLMLKQAASTGNGTATFTGVKWNLSGAPTITPTAGSMDILSFFSDGTNWYGSYTQGYTP